MELMARGGPYRSAHAEGNRIFTRLGELCFGYNSTTTVANFCVRVRIHQLHPENAATNKMVPGFSGGENLCVRVYGEANGFRW